jgi:hypothetical protein
VQRPLTLKRRRLGEFPSGRSFTYGARHCDSMNGRSPSHHLRASARLFRVPNIGVATRGR